MQSQPIQMMQMRAVVWDLHKWLPFDISEAGGQGTGLSGDSCWHGVFRQPMFAQLLQEILQHPAEVVMLQLRCCERFSCLSTCCLFAFVVDSPITTLLLSKGLQLGRRPQIADRRPGGRRGLASPQLDSQGGRRVPRVPCQSVGPDFISWGTALAPGSPPSSEVFAAGRPSESIDSRVLLSSLAPKRQSAVESRHGVTCPWQSMDWCR